MGLTIFHLKTKYKHLQTPHHGTLICINNYTFSLVKSLLFLFTAFAFSFLLFFSPRLRRCLKGTEMRDKKDEREIMFSVYKC